MSADSDLICSEACEEAVKRVDWASRALVRIEFAELLPTAVNVRSTSAEVS